MEDEKWSKYLPGYKPPPKEPKLKVSTAVQNFLNQTKNSLGEVNSLNGTTHILSRKEKRRNQGLKKWAREATYNFHRSMRDDKA